MLNKSNILEFKKADKNHVHGDAVCFQCKHTWIATSTIGTVQLECPNCKTMKGLFRFPFAPNENQLLRKCSCGCQLFYITHEGHMCTNCGTFQEY